VQSALQCVAGGLCDRSRSVGNRVRGTGFVVTAGEMQSCTFTYSLHRTEVMLRS
jgi:hypothetical protein